MFNIHTHIFNMDCAPDDFAPVQSRIAGKVVSKLRNDKFRKVVLKVLNPFAQKLVAFFTVGSFKTQDLIFEDLASHYPKGTKIVVLPINFEHMNAGKSPLNLLTQLQGVIDVKMSYPETCLPFIPIDPRHEGNLVDFIKNYLSKGFVGIKIYPSLGFYPFDKRLEPVYDFCQENQLPIMTHCTRFGIYYKGKKVPIEIAKPESFNATARGFEQLMVEIKKTGYDAKPPVFCDHFLNPDCFYDVLEKFPELKICIAHVGGEEEVKKAMQKPNEDNWYFKTLELVGNYKNVYTDVSFTAIHKKELAKIKHDFFDNQTLRDKFKFDIREKIMYGSDYFMILKESTETFCLENAKTVFNEDFDKISNTNAKKFVSSAFYKVG